MKVYLASDHAGLELKTVLVEWLQVEGHEVVDVGPHEYDSNDDYPDFIIPMAQKVAQDLGSFGIAIGASGQGEAMAANRVRGARAALYYGPASRSQTDLSGKTLNMITSTREHNNANILSLGARFMSEEEVKSAVALWLSTPFSNEERHARRIAKLDHE